MEKIKVEGHEVNAYKKSNKRDIIHFRADIELIDKLQYVARKTDINSSELMRQALRNFLAEAMNGEFTIKL
jgi:predicted transcriptional regulator